MGISLNTSDPKFQRKQNARDARRKANDYKPAEYWEKDAARSRSRALPDVQQLYLKYVRLFLEFLVKEKGRPEDSAIGEGYPAPGLEVLKEFIRWYYHSTRGRLDERPTMRSTLLCAQRFCPGFFIATGSRISHEDKNELYSWIEKDLTIDGEIKDIQKTKFNFTKDDFIQTLTAFWTLDDAAFIHGRNRIQIPLAIQLYMFSGARIGAFMPSAEDKGERGLCYKHIHLVLFRSPRDDTPWRIGWRLDQQWVKNNRSPENIVFGIPLWDHEKPLFSTALNLLALAIEDNALYGFHSIQDIFEQQIPDGDSQLPLRWKDEVKERCIIRNATADGVTEDPMTELQFNSLFRNVTKSAGYSKAPSVHAMRRALGKKVNEKHNPGTVAQILTHGSEGIYGDSYVANCSSISTVDIVLGQKEDTTHADYFQGYRQFYEKGLPQYLPAIEEERLRNDPSFSQMESDLKGLIAENADKLLIQTTRSKCGTILRRLRLNALQQYQSEWVQKQRDWKILTRGKLSSDCIEQSTRFQTLCKAMPELGRLAAVMSGNEPLSFDQKIVVAKDLHTHIARNFDVFYRPGEEPCNGLCPVDGCGQVMQRLQKWKRSAHIHNCIRRKLACERGIREAKLRYCYECFSWKQECEWERHCESHLAKLPSMHSQCYEVFVYRHTLIGAGHCVWCTWNKRLKSSKRMAIWSRSDSLKNHIDSHIVTEKWPASCPDPQCNAIWENELDLRRHLYDIHGYHKSNLKRAKDCSNLKRRAPVLSEPVKKKQKPLRIIQWEPSRVKGTASEQQVADPSLATPSVDSSETLLSTSDSEDNLPAPSSGNTEHCLPHGCINNLIENATSPSFSLSGDEGRELIPIDPELQQLPPTEYEQVSDKGQCAEATLSTHAAYTNAKVSTSLSCDGRSQSETVRGADFTPENTSPPHEYQNEGHKSPTGPVTRSKSAHLGIKRAPKGQHKANTHRSAQQTYSAPLTRAKAKS